MKKKFIKFLEININTETDQECRHYGRITITPTESTSGEIKENQGITGKNQMGLTPEQVTLVQMLIKQLQWSTTLSRIDLAKRLNDCLSSLNTRPHIVIVRKLNLNVKSYKSRKQKQITKRPINGPLEIEIHTDASCTVKATMGQVGIIRQKELSSGFPLVKHDHNQREERHKRSGTSCHETCDGRNRNLKSAYSYITSV